MNTSQAIPEEDSSLPVRGHSGTPGNEQGWMFAPDIRPGLPRLYINYFAKLTRNGLGRNTLLDQISTKTVERTKRNTPVTSRAINRTYGRQ